MRSRAAATVAVAAIPTASGTGAPRAVPSSSVSPGADVAFEVVADGLAAPIGLVTAPGDAGRSLGPLGHSGRVYRIVSVAG